MKKVILIILGSAWASGCVTTQKSARHGAKKSVVAMVNNIDTKDWKGALARFDKTVFVDYSSMTGQAGSETKAKDLVGSWSKLLKNVDTHHMLTNFDIKISGDVAEIFSHVYASHSAKDIKYWDIFGRYHFKLNRSSSGWKINFMKLLVHGQRGNLKFLQEVSK